MSFLLKISILAEEIEALKKEKGETDEARRIAEEQIEAMIKDHEEKVISPSVFTFGLSQSYVFQTLNIGSWFCRLQRLAESFQMFKRVGLLRRRRNEQPRKL